MEDKIYGVVEDYQVGPGGTIRGTVRVADPADAPRWNELLSVDMSTKMGSLGYVTLVDEPIDPACHVYDIVTSTETTVPPDDTKPRENHVRDAVRANQ
ncbi:hypothetical protein [Paraburkholderia caledonica]|uniref:Uncharacterized protein n=1 Tax=Paraburkholderia caledonica TaxID=134536 RepID=A0AB73I3I2_9BURK|nr:hypothetical protein [Paraburkholderia caledonica]